MKLCEIYQRLDAISPFELQEGWDNSGLQVGDMEREIKHVYLSLDVDSAMLEGVKEDSLIITHHPLIFKGLKSVDFAYYPSSLIEIMIKKSISQIAMHTNFDKTHLNLHVAKEVLGFEVIKSEDYLAKMKIDMEFDKLCAHVKKVLNLDVLRCVKAKDFIKTATLTTGSGGDFINQIKDDCFLTGDIKYHQALNAKEQNLSILDIGHFESERYFVDALQKELKNFPLKAIITNSNNPFEYK